MEKKGDKKRELVDYQSGKVRRKVTSRTACPNQSNKKLSIY
ncbi:hypothetical protein ACM26V_14115 [Salipaludibacillus sp. HK11]